MATHRKELSSETADCEHETFAQDVHDLVSSWLDQKAPIPECWRGDTDPIKSMTSSKIEVLGMAGHVDLVSQAMKTVSRLKSTTRFFRELGSELQSKLDTAEANLFTVKNMRGFFSLPNELVIRIFDCMVNGDPSPKLSNSDRCIAAVTLSHVSQYFRRVAVSCPYLWKNIGHGNGMASLYLSRSGGVPLDVDLEVALENNDAHDLRFERSLPTKMADSQRWRGVHLHVRFEPERRYGEGIGRTPLTDADIRRSFRDLNVQSLETLRITNDRYRTPSHSHLPWNTPNLRTLILINYVPRFFRNLENITIFNITIVPTLTNHAELLNGFSKMISLEDFTMRLDFCFIGPPPASLPPRRTELPSVRRVRIEAMEQESNHHHIGELFSALVFPRAVRLHVRHYSLDEDLHYENNEFKMLEFSSILKHVGQFPRVEHFELEIYGYTEGSFASRSGFVNSGSGAIDLIGDNSPPIHMVPSAKHFTLRSNRELSTSRSAKWYERSSIGLEHALPTFETISFNLPAAMSSRMKKWIRGLLQRQKEDGKWEEFREIVVLDVVDVGGMRVDKVVGVYAKDAALAWCNRLLP